MGEEGGSMGMRVAEWEGWWLSGRRVAQWEEGGSVGSRVA